MIIDTHSQLWTKEALVSLPELMYRTYRAVFGESVENLSEKATIKDMDAAGVERSVVVAVDAETTYNYKVPNELVAVLRNKYPDRIIGFAGVDPHKGKLAVKELEHAVKDLGLSGLKLMPHLMELNPNDRLLYPLYETATALGIPILFHAGTQYHTGSKIKYCHPIFFDDVAADFPNLKIIIAHFGWPWVTETIAIVMRNKNVYFNIAGWAPKHLPSELINYMNGPLSNKALFGSDFPLLSRKRIIEELHAVPLKKEVLNKLLVENPARVLSLQVNQRI